MTKITTIGLDIAKDSFAVHGFDLEGMYKNSNHLTVAARVEI